MDINNFAYLLFNVVIVCSVFIGKLFYKKTVLPTLSDFKSIFPVIIFFIIWDIVVTNTWWYFNPNFLLFSHSPLKIPFEEILFFFTVPFGLLTLTKNIQPLIKDAIIKSDMVSLFSLILKIFFTGVGIYALTQGLSYTFTIAVTLLLSLTKNLLKSNLFLIGSGLTLLLTLIFNYYLTYLPVVTYNSMYKTNILIGTIPVEDFGYGLLLYVLMFRKLYAKR